MPGPAQATTPEKRLARIEKRTLRFIRYRPFSAFLLVLALAFAATLGTMAAVGVWPGSVIYDDGVFGMSLAVDAAGALHVVFVNASLVYATNAGGRWTTHILDSGTPYAVAVAADSEGRADVLEDVFNRTAPNEELGHVRYFTDASGAWSDRTITDAGASPSLTLDRTGAVHIAYLWANESLMLNRTTEFHYVTNADGRWSDSVVYSLPYDLTISSATAIAATDTGEVAITLSLGGNFLGYLTNASGGWSFTWLADVPSGSGIHGVAPVAIDSLGRGHVIYTAFDGATNTTRLIHATDTGSGWTLEPIQVVEGALSCSMGLDAADHVHLAYVDARGALTYMTNAEGSWSASPVDPQASSIPSPSIAVMPSGGVAVAYEAVRPPPWGFTLGQTFVRVAGSGIEAWNVADFLTKAAPFLTAELFLIGAVVWLARPPRWLPAR